MSEIKRVSNEFHIIEVQYYFHNIFSKYTDEKNIIKLFTEVVKSYSAKSRHYHNMHHIHTMCTAWDLFNSKLNNPDAIFMAIIYHDIVYSAIKSNNEEKSADYFKKNVSTVLNLDSIFIKKVYDAILSTKHNDESKKYWEDDIDIQYLLDFDLHILGTRHESEYEWYKNGVRKEYKIYPDLIYKPGRKKVLESFLKRKKIYLTEDFKVNEKKARKNLNNEIKMYLC